MGVKDTKRPARVDKAPEKKAEAVARVESDVKAGSIVLVGEKRRFTLAWTADDKVRTRAVPPGTYSIRTVRLLRSHRGSTWVRSSSSPRAEPTEYAAGKTSQLTVGEEVHIHASAVIRKGKLNLGFALKTERGSGTSVFKDGKRVSIGYDLLDKSGHKVASGTMKYG